MMKTGVTEGGATGGSWWATVVTPKGRTQKSADVTSWRVHPELKRNCQSRSDFILKAHRVTSSALLLWLNHLLVSSQVGRILSQLGNGISSSAGLCPTFISRVEIFIQTLVSGISWWTWAALDSPAPSTPCARSTSSMLWVSTSQVTIWIIKVPDSSAQVPL